MYQSQIPAPSIRLSSRENNVTREIKRALQRVPTSLEDMRQTRIGHGASFLVTGLVPNLVMQLNAATDALLVIDLQNDFCPGGALAVDGGDEIVPVVNSLAQRFAHVLLTQDWHPAGHISFASAHPDSDAQPYTTIAAPYGPQTLWPDHCVQNTPGADFHPALSVPHAELILRKGFRREIDSYSAFLENDHATPTGLAGYLRERGLRRLFFCGLAYDFCVRFSAIDGTALDFECLVIQDASRAVRLHASVRATDQAFEEAGIRRIEAADVLAR
jgi:nicotinamidase/pyrazinamidase